MAEVKATAKEEKVARILAGSRGVDADGSVTMSDAEGVPAVFDPAWHGYLPTAREIVKAVSRK